MGAWNYLWHFVFSLFLCARTGMTEGRNLTTATTQIHVNGSVSTDPDRTTGPDGHNPSATVAEPNTTTAPSLLNTSFLSPSTMRMVGGEGRTETEPTVPNGEGSSRGASARSDAVSRDTPTTGPGGTATSSASSLSPRPSSTGTSRSLSSPGGSTSATPSPQRSSTSGDTEEHSATTARPSTTLVFSTSGTGSVWSAAVTAEPVTHSPTTPRTVASPSDTSPATDTTEASLLSTPGGSTKTSAARLTSAPLTQGQATGEAGITPSSMGSPLAPTTTASAATSATTPPGEGESPTMNQGRETTTKLNAGTAHSLPTTSLVSPSTTRTVGGEGRTETTMQIWEGNSPGVSTGSAATSPAVPTETLAAPHTSTPLTQGQATGETRTTTSSMESPLASTTTASVGNSATTSPAEGESPTINQGSPTTNGASAETSHSLPDTSLATPSTPNLNIPTSANPSVTGTCTPITLSIQLENVTSTMIQFSWKPQGGTGDSPYTVLLRGKSGEVEKKILNGTSTAFANLLSGHQYQISVDVSTCSKNVSTSLIVQTAAEIYSGTTRITNKEFKPEYQNKSSTEFQEFNTTFIAEITEHLPQRIQELKNGTKMRIIINSIENGSVVVLFDVVLDVGPNITKPEISDAFTEALNMSTEFKVDPEKTFIEARNSCQPGLNDCSQNAACTAEGATYSCQCKEGFTDNSPQVPGRVCQQNLPPQQMTTVPTETDTTGATERTTPVSPETETTGATEQTIPVSPETETTGVTEQTTPISPETDSTGITEQTTPISPETDSTGITEQTTPVSPETETTGVTEQTTSVSPETEPTGVTEQTTPISPETETTGVTEQTTPVSPETEPTGVTEQTTSVSPGTETTGVTKQTTPVPPETETTGITEQTTPISPETDTTGITEQTTPISPETDSTGITEQTTPVSPETEPTGVTEQTTPVSPGTDTIGVTGQTTPVSPGTETTGVTKQTTTVSPETETTGVTEQTTPISPETDSTGITEQTTPISPETDSTGITEQTTPVSPETEPTGVTEQTTSVSPETETTGVTEQTTPISPETETTGVTEQTTPISPETDTTGVTNQKTTVPLKTSTIGFTVQTTTVPENDTTGFTGSTSNSIFTTTFPSPPCMPVSVEIQNVTGEEIQLSWMGGSTGSLYSISLMDRKQEINKTTTKDTKAVFKHLFPARVYTISVGVSSCAENNRTSVTVRTDPVSCFSRTEFCLPENTGCSDLKDIVCSDNQAFACSVSLKRQTFNNTLYNSDSDEYKAVAESIETDVVREMRLKLKDDRFDITVLGFKPGSVVADFISLLPKEEPVDVDVIRTHLSQVFKRKFGDETELAVQRLSVQSPTDNISAWRVAVIVLGVLLGVALVLILLAIIFYIYMSRRWGKYFVEPRDSWENLSKSAYKMKRVSFTHLE